MQHVRLTVRHNPDDPADDLRVASKLRHDLWARSLLLADGDNPRRGTHRDAQSNAYFEFDTGQVDDVSQFIRTHSYGSRVKAEVMRESAGEECVSCGNISGPVLPSVCPNCRFRDIGPCPHCGHEIPRRLYRDCGDGTHACPDCTNRVTLRLNDPLFDESGDYIQPLVLVEKPSAKTAHRENCGRGA